MSPDVNFAVFQGRGTKLSESPTTAKTSPGYEGSSVCFASLSISLTVLQMIWFCFS